MRCNKSGHPLAGGMNESAAYRSAWACVCASLVVWLAPVAAHAKSVVTVAMTAGDIPNTTATPTRGSRGPFRRLQPL